MDVSCSEISGEINFVLFVETYGQRFLYLGSVINTISKVVEQIFIEKVPKCTRSLIPIFRDFAQCF